LTCWKTVSSSSGRNGHIRRAAHGYEPTREAAMAALSEVLAARVTLGQPINSLIN
jgi:hypothetical protein